MNKHNYIDFEELWAVVEIAPDCMISTKGRVKRITDDGEQVLPFIRNSEGYLRVRFNDDTENTYYFVHRLVAENFIDNPWDKKEINHIDGDRTNNHIDNLEWVTPSENSLDAKRRMVKRPNKKMVIQVHTLNGNYVRSFKTIPQVATFLNRGQTSVVRALEGKTKSCGGYRLSYSKNFGQQLSI